MVGMMTPSLGGFRRSSISRVPQQARPTQLDNGGRECWLELRRSADVERPEIAGPGSRLDR